MEKNYMTTGRATMNVCAIVMAIVITMGACSQKNVTYDDDKSVAEKVRTGIAASAFSGVIEISADFGGRASDYTADFARTSDGGVTLVITKPDVIAGIKASVGAAGGAVEFDGMILETGKLPGTGTSPVGAVSLLTSAWSGGRVISEGRSHVGDLAVAELTYEVEMVAAQESEPGVATVITWFDEQSFMPVAAEIFAKGARILTVKFPNIALNS